MIRRQTIRPAQRHRSRPLVHALEDRAVPATYTVTNTNDSGAGSLRAAVALANGNAGADTIEFSTSAPFNTDATISLNTKSYIDIAITDGLIVNGPTSNRITIKAGSGGRAFSVASATPVEINNLTITGGNLTSSHGAGISVDNTSLTLNSCKISGNTTGANGGGIYMSYATMTLNSCTVTTNTASSSSGNGGGIYNYKGTLTVSSSSVTSNSAGQDGGGIANFNANCTLSDSSVSVANNKAARYGGGILFNQADGFLLAADVNSVIEGNSAYDGGGFYGLDGTIDVASPTSIRGNIASRDGGGGYMIDCIFTCSSAEIGASGKPNTAANHGGGIWAEGSTLTFTDATVSYNLADDDGGGIYATDSDLLFEGKSFVEFNESDQDGGGVFASDSTVTIESSTSFGGNTAASRGGAICATSSNLYATTTGSLSDNRAKKGGSIYSDGTVTIQGSAKASVTFSSNIAELGGAIMIDTETGHLTAEYAYFDKNRAEGPDTGSTSITCAGGGVYLLNLSANAPTDDSTFTNCIFNDCYALSATIFGSDYFDGEGYGGAIAIEGPNEVSILGNTNPSPAGFDSITGFANKGGGAVAIVGLTGDDSTVLIMSTVLLGGLARSGAQLYMEDAEGEITIAACQFGGGTAFQGGGLYVTGKTSPDIPTIKISGSVFGDTVLLNAPEVEVGSGIALVDSDASITVTDTVIRSATATGSTTHAGGGGLLVENSSAIITNLTIQDIWLTAASAQGAGALVDGASTVVFNSCVFKGNTASGVGSKGGGLALNSGSITLNGCDLNSNTADFGGGFFADSSSVTLAKMQDCNLDGNTAVRQGGGAFFGTLAGATTVAANTFSNNIVTGIPMVINGHGGGIYHLSSTSITVANCTLASNTAQDGDGGGIYSASGTLLRVFNSTIADNSAGVNGGGIFSQSATTVTLNSSMVAGNSAGNANPDGHATVAETYSIVENTSGLTVHGPGTGNNNGTDPLLAPFSDYGGRTKTFALLSGSPAIDKGANDLTLAYDQRGNPFVRESPSGKSDMGSYESRQYVTLTRVESYFDSTQTASRVNALRVYFDQPVTIATGNATPEFTLKLSSNSVGLNTTAYSNNVATITFNSSGAVTLEDNNGLPEGIFDLTAKASEITGAYGGGLDGNGDGTPGDDATTKLHRLFGDANGDKFVDLIDFVAFRAAYGSDTITPGSQYTPIFDYDVGAYSLDGYIDSIDFGRDVIGGPIGFFERFGDSMAY